MEAHVKTLGILYVCLGALCAMAAVAVLVLFGGAAGLVATSAETSEAVMAVPIIGLAGGLVAVFLLVLAIPGLLAGFGLLTFRPWARVLTLVLNVINLVNFPLGTVIGVYGLWVLLSPETEALFGLRPAPRA